MSTADTKIIKTRQSHSDWYIGAMEQLVDVVQEISHARDLGTIMAIVRRSARHLTGADGATFVLRDGDKCFYADEDAISPLWKGQRFSMKTCISGWVMINAQPAVIEDIYKDARIPESAYRPTFVKSLAMVPIRTDQPVGAIGNYWAKKRQPTKEEVSILQALANVTSVALENVELYDRLQENIKALEASNEDLRSLAWAAAHDLKSPLQVMNNLAQWIEDDFVKGDYEKTQHHIQNLKRRTKRTEKLLVDILEYSSIQNSGRLDEQEYVDGQVLMDDIRSLISLPDAFTLNFSPEFSNISVQRIVLQRVFCNLIENAIKHHDHDEGKIEITVDVEQNHYVFAVRDDGPGIPEKYQGKIFDMFQTLKPRDVTEGSGLGLAIVKKMLSVHGSEISVESGPERGAVFRFTWPQLSVTNEGAT